MEIDDSRETKKVNPWQGTHGRDYNRNTDRLKPREGVKRIVEKMNPGTAIEIGPGAGNDTVFLLKNGWSVCAVDINEDSKTRIESKLDDSLKDKFTFLRKSFEGLSLEKETADVVVAYNSLHFCDKEYFDEFFSQVIDSIKSNGYFVGNLIGKNHSWNKDNLNPKMPFFSKEEIIELFKKFDLSEDSIQEKEFDGTTTSGKPTHWHLFFIEAKKK